MRHFKMIFIASLGFSSRVQITYAPFFDVDWLGCSNSPARFNATLGLLIVTFAVLATFETTLVKFVACFVHVAPRTSEGLRRITGWLCTGTRHARVSLATDVQKILNLGHGFSACKIEHQDLAPIVQGNVHVRF
jgi:hypothetical protein